VTARGRRLAVQARAHGHTQLELHEVESRRDLGDGMLDLKPGVDLEEGEGLVVGLVEELHGPGVAIAGRTGQVDCRSPQLVLLPGAEGGRARLLDHLLVAALDRAVPYARCPDRAVVVGDDLDLDVPRAAEQALDEDRRIGEGANGLGLRALERRRELGLGSRHADATAAAPGGSLDHDRIADRPRVLDCGVRRLHRLAAPGGHRHSGLLGEQLGPDLVAQAAHDVRRRADEGNTVAGA
jgi:hypothetical protein